MKPEVSLGFDPFSDLCGEIRAIFADMTARTLWMLWKQGHITGEGFNADVLAIAKRIRERKPETAEALGECFPTRYGGPMQNFTASDVASFVIEALPFFTGERIVTFRLKGGEKSTAERLREFAGLPEFVRTETAKLMLAAADELDAARMKAGKVARWILTDRARLTVGETDEQRAENMRSPLPVRLWMTAQELTDDRAARIASDQICNEQRRKLGLPEQPADPMIALLHGTPR